MQAESITQISLTLGPVFVYLLRAETILASVTILDAIDLGNPTSAVTITDQERILHRKAIKASGQNKGICQSYEQHVRKTTKHCLLWVRTNTHWHS